MPLPVVPSLPGVYAGTGAGAQPPAPLPHLVSPLSAVGVTHGQRPGVAGRSSRQPFSLLLPGWEPAEELLGPATLRLAGMLPQWAQGQHRDARNENSRLTAQWPPAQGWSIVLCWPGWHGGDNSWAPGWRGGTAPSLPVLHRDRVHLNPAAASLEQQHCCQYYTAHPGLMPSQGIRVTAVPLWPCAGAVFEHHCPDLTL